MSVPLWADGIFLNPGDCSGVSKMKSSPPSKGLYIIVDRIQIQIHTILAKFHLIQLQKISIYIPSCLWGVAQGTQGSVQTCSKHAASEWEAELRVWTDVHLNTTQDDLSMNEKRSLSSSFCKQWRLATTFLLHWVEFLPSGKCYVNEKFFYRPLLRCWL